MIQISFDDSPNGFSVRRHRRFGFVVGYRWKKFGAFFLAEIAGRKTVGSAIGAHIQFDHSQFFDGVDQRSVIFFPSFGLFGLHFRVFTLAGAKNPQVHAALETLKAGGGPVTIGGMTISNASAPAQPSPPAEPTPPVTAGIGGTEW